MKGKKSKILSFSSPLFFAPLVWCVDILSENYGMYSACFPSISYDAHSFTYIVYIIFPKSLYCCCCNSRYKPSLSLQLYIIASSSSRWLVPRSIVFSPMAFRPIRLVLALFAVVTWLLLPSVDRSSPPCWLLELILEVVVEVWASWAWRRAERKKRERELG